MGNMNRRWKLFVGKARDYSFTVFIGISLGILVGAVIVQVNSLATLKELNGLRADVVEARTEMVEVGDEWVESMRNTVDLTYEAIELREKVRNSEGTEEEINAARARIEDIEIGLEKAEANKAVVEALRLVLEAEVLRIETEIVRLEQAIEYDWRVSSLLLSIGVLMLSSGLALGIYRISRKRN